MARMRLSAVDTHGNIITSIVFNRTFFIPQMGNSFRVAPVAIPRAHGDRLPVRTYLAGRPISLSGYIGTGYASSPNAAEIAIVDGALVSDGRVSTGGSVQGFVQDSRTPSKYLQELQLVFKRLHAQRTVILDLGNGWFFYVRPQAIQSVMSEGAPDLRQITIALHAADPLVYSTTLTSGEFEDTPDQSAIQLPAYAAGIGSVPSTNWAMEIFVPGPSAGRRIMVGLKTRANGFTLATGPDSANQTFVIDGYRRVIYNGAAPEAFTWSMWEQDSHFFTLDPEDPENQILFTDAANMIPMSVSPLVDGVMTDTGAVIGVNVVGRAADWMGDTVYLPEIPAPGRYDTARYGIDIYG